MTRKVTARMKAATWVTAMAAGAVLGSAAAGLAQSGKDLDSIAAEKEPNLSCDQIIGQKAAGGPGMTNEKLAEKLKISKKKVDDCLGVKPAPAPAAPAQ